MSNRATREVGSRTPKREPIVKVASRENEQFVNVGAIMFHRGEASCGRWPEMDRRGKVEAVQRPLESQISTPAVYNNSIF
jgi:hypothetical protein